MMEGKDYTISDDNIFANDGWPNPEERMVRAQLLYYIATEIKRRKLSQRQAADLLGVPQPHISLLLQAKLSNFSLERLLQMTTRLGVDLAISGQLTNEQGSTYHNLPDTRQGALSGQSMVTSTGKRAAIYARSFQSKILRGKSLEGEVERCQAYCARCGYHVEEGQIYCEVQSESDGQGQPELDRLVAAAQRGCIDIVVITGPGRLSSSPAELITIIQQFQSIGVRIETTEPSFLDRTKLTEQGKMGSGIQSRQKKRSRWTEHEIVGVSTIQQQNSLRRVAIYAKGDTNSLQEQVKRCQAYCTSNSYKIGKDQLYCEVQEGTNEQDHPELNPELNRLMEVAKNGLLDVVVLTNVQMFTRRPSYLAAILQVFQDAGVQVETIE